MRRKDERGQRCVWDTSRSFESTEGWVPVQWVRRIFQTRRRERGMKGFQRKYFRSSSGWWSSFLRGKDDVESLPRSREAHRDPCVFLEERNGLHSVRSSPYLCLSQERPPPTPSPTIRMVQKLPKGYLRRETPSLRVTQGTLSSQKWWKDR